MQTGGMRFGASVTLAMLLLFALPRFSGLPDVPLPVVAAMWVVVAVLVLVGIRLILVGVKITDSTLVVRNLFKTYRVDLEDIRRVDTKRKGAGFKGYVELRDGQELVMFGLQQANAFTHPRPFDRLDAAVAVIADAVRGGQSQKP